MGELAISVAHRGLRLLLQNVSSVSPPPSVFAHPPSTDVSQSLNHSSGYASPSQFNRPFMGIVLAVLLVTFVLMTALSVYVHRFSGSFRRVSHHSVVGAAPSAQGLDHEAIEGLPIAVFHKSKDISVRGVEPNRSCSRKDDQSGVTTLKEGTCSGAHQAHEWRRRAECAICLTEFQEAEFIRMLPKCEHCFHQQCIEMWLLSHSTCPLCRSALISPTTTSPPTYSPAI
ncbi:hypothetical protein KP509_29G079100 [Ceratopteris richardii]|uniref:RING-type E3 ubiquitin transferase n=1 Tax=Ceratopteris richardii TaxID=49495 RepID=A0A8T2RAE7_CERRI|nr:hypothetical protein KP509_29G079100 [Ceratopteris richardii]